MPNRPFVDEENGELPSDVVVNKTNGVAVAPLASLIGASACGVSVSVKLVSELGFVMSANLSVNSINE